MPRVTIQNEGRTVEIAPNANLRTALLRARADLYAGASAIFNCRGLGVCGTCDIVVIAGAENLTERTPREIRKLRTNDRCRRLACQCAIIGDAEVTVNTLCP